MAELPNFFFLHDARSGSYRDYMKRVYLCTSLQMYSSMKPLTIIRLFLVTALLFLACSCQKDKRYEKSEKATLTLRVYEGINPLGNSVKYYVHLYEGATKWYPLIHVWDGNNDWGLEPGFEYEVSVWKHYVKGSETMGGSNSFEYEFQKVLSKKEVPLLTMDDILWESIML